MTTTVADARIIELPRIDAPEGSLTPVHAHDTVPFEIARVYYIYDVVGGAERGGHAHRALEQLIVCVMGGFHVVLDDGADQRRVELKSASTGLYLPPMIWREIVEFTAGAICLVLASRAFEEADYIRDYESYRRAKGRSAPVGAS